MWYSSGTVSVENGSDSVIGDGTAFLSNVRVGDGMAIEGSLALHEIINVASETGITISPAYEGPSGGGMRFTVVPVLGYDKDLSDAFNRIRLEMGAKVQGLQPWAYANTAAEARDDLGLGSGATGDVVQEVGDSQSDVMSQKATSDALDTKADGNDPRLSDSREWNAGTISKAEAEAGTATTRRAWTAQRVRQAIAAWWNSVASASGKTVATGTPAQGRSALGLGTAATRDVGEASGDVMGVGAFGLGSESPHVLADTHDAPATGVYRLYQSDNQPADFSSFAVFNVMAFKKGTEPFAGLFAMEARNHPNTFLGKTKNNAGEWEPWVIFFHTGNILTTTGQSTEYPMTQKAVTDAINGVSDRRDKVDITPNSVGLDLIERLEPVSFRLNKRDWYRKQAATSIETHTDEDGSQTEVEKVDPDIVSKSLSEFDNNDGSLARDDKYTGLIAQDVKSTLEELGLSDLAIIKNYADEYEGGEDRFYIEYNGLIPVMINAIKELSARVKELEENHDS